MSEYFEIPAADALMAHAPDAMVLVDGTGRIHQVSDEAVLLLGYGRDELVGLNVDQLVPEATRGAHQADRTHYQADPVRRPMASGLDLKARRKDGSLVPVEIALSPIETDGHLWILTSIRDVTERKALEVEAASARDQHHEALSMLAERERIGRDLHDMVIQRLFAAGMSLQAVAPMADGLVAERLEDTVTTLDESIAELRSTIFELGNQQADRSLAAQVARVVDTKTSAFDLEVDVSVDVAVTPAEPVRDSLLATLGEALANVGRHADATHVTVSVATKNQHLSLSVVDDGVGFDPTARRGNGIDNMMWRAGSLGGRCVVEPGEERGTMLHWEVPTETADAPEPPNDGGSEVTGSV